MDGWGGPTRPAPSVWRPVRAPCGRTPDFVCEARGRAPAEFMTIVLDIREKPRHPEKVHRPDVPALKKPDWIRVKAPVSRGYQDTRDIVRANGLHTVCEGDGCPNIGECWEKKHATFMIMGDTCTRACAFCNVKTGLPGALDPDEPAHVAQAV